jgi:hypothetical protein
VDHPVSGVKVWTGAGWKVATPENLKLGVPYSGQTGRWSEWRPTQRGTAYWNLTAQQHTINGQGNFLGLPFTWTAGAGWRKTIGDFMEDQSLYTTPTDMGIPNLPNSFQTCLPDGARWKWTWSAPTRGSGGTLTVTQGRDATLNPVVAGPTGGGIGWTSTYSPAVRADGHTGEATRLGFEGGSLAPTQWWDVQVTELAIVDANNVPIQWEVPGNLRAWDGIRWVAP